MERSPLPESNRLAYDFFVLVWGEPFVQNFVETTLPAQLSPGNLPALSRAADVTYHIYTDRASEAALTAGAQDARDHARLEFHFFDELSTTDGNSFLAHARDLRPPEYKYEIQNLCARHLFDLVGDDDRRAFVVVDSNMILSEGSLAAMHARRRAGWKAVMVNALRLSQEGALAALRSMEGHGNGYSPRQLVRLALENPHHIAENSFADSDPFTPYPSQLYWRVGDDGILGRAFLPHPLMVCQHPALKNFQSTMDYDLALRGW